MGSPVDLTKRQQLFGKQDGIINEEKRDRDLHAVANDLCSIVQNSTRLGWEISSSRVDYSVQPACAVFFHQGA